MRIFTLLLILYLSLPACSQTTANKQQKKNTVEQQIKALLKNDGMKHASFGFYAADTKTGKVIAQYNPEKSLSPASTQKLIATSTALETFGEDYRFETKIQYSGKIDQNGILHGNIYIRGGGDPVLGSERFEAHYGSLVQKWAQAIQKAGIRKIQGAVVGDASIYSHNIVPRLRAWEDMANYYGIGACGLTIHDNVYRISFDAGYHDGDPTKIIKTEPQVPGLTLENHVKASKINRDQAYIFGAPYTFHRYILGTIPKGKKNFTIKGALPDPALFAAQELEKNLKNKGIELALPATTVRNLSLAGKQSPQERQTIHTTLSPTLRQIVRKTNKISYNLYPEHLMAHLGLNEFLEGSVEKGIEAAEKFWRSKGMDTQGLFIYDGSGLTRYNSLTAKQLFFVLNYMKNKGRYFEAFYESLPIAGKDGTLRYLCRGTAAQNNLRAKSGSISKVRAYAGYVTTQSGREIAFAMLSNNYTCTDYQMREHLEKLMVNLAQVNF